MRAPTLPFLPSLPAAAQAAALALVPLACLLASGVLASAHAADAPAPPALGASEPASRVPEPEIRRSVEEDEHVRIEELRVRGQVQQVVVQPKLPHAPAYEILQGQPGRDPANGRGARVWNVFNF